MQRGRFPSKHIHRERRTINTPMVGYKLLIVKDVIQNVETLRKLDTLIRAGASVLFSNGTVGGDHALLLRQPVCGCQHGDGGDKGPPL